MRTANVGETLTDSQGRTFEVLEVDPRNDKISGKLTTPYSCDQKIFDAVWVEKVPPSDSRTFKVG